MLTKPFKFQDVKNGDEVLTDCYSSPAIYIGPDVNGRDEYAVVRLSHDSSLISIAIERLAVKVKMKTYFIQVYRANTGGIKVTEPNQWALTAKSLGQIHGRNIGAVQKIELPEGEI